MSQPGRKPGVNNTARVRNVLKSQSLRWMPVSDLMAKIGADMSEGEIRQKLSYLVKEGQAVRTGRGEKAKWKYKATDKPQGRRSNGKIEIGNAMHQQMDEHKSSTSNQPPEFLPQVALDVRASQVVDEVDEHEPAGTFKITGSLIGTDHSFKGMVVQIASPGFSNRPHLLTEM